MQRTALSQSVAWQEAMSLIGRVERATKSGSLGLRRQLQERAMSVAVGVAPYVITKRSRWYPIVGDVQSLTLS